MLSWIVACSLAVLSYFSTQAICLVDDSFEFTQIFAPSPERLDRFGGAIGIDSGELAVGVHGDTIAGSTSGTIMVFDLQGGQFRRILIPEDAQPDDRFGISLDLHDGMVVGGAWGDDDLGPFSGSAYVFDVSSGDQLLKLLPNDGQRNDQFGHAVGVSGGVVAVGSASDDDLGSMTGAVYFFDAQTGAQLSKLVPEDGGPQQNFGLRLIFRDELLIVSATGDDDRGSDSGSVYVYSYPELELMHKLVPDDLEKDDFFGDSISLFGNSLVVGGLRNSGAQVYVYDLITGLITSKLSAPDELEGDVFGSSVAMSDQYVFVGASQCDGASMRSGCVYVFDRVTGEYAITVQATGGQTGDEFGASVAFGNGVLCVGAPFNSDRADRAGSVYLFPASCSADLNGDARVDQSDIQTLLGLVASGDLRADFFDDGILNFFDISVYIGLYNEPCFPTSR